MKKFFEMPEVTVEKFEEADILTLSPEEEGETPLIPW